MTTEHRTCGDCTMCCFTLGVKELEKPARQWCKHCNIGVGCTIYNERPKSCENFSCLWLTHPETPKAMFPRICGVVCWITDDGKTAIALTRQHEPWAWRRAPVIKTLQKLAAGGMTVIAFNGTRAWVIGPTKEEELPADAIELDGFGLNKLTISAEARKRVAPPQPMPRPLMFNPLMRLRR